METRPNIASAAFLIADPARAAMLMCLLDGNARPAGDLAYAAGVTPQTASSHLSKLLSGGLLSVETQGRHRYYRFAGDHVAVVLENLALIGSTDNARRRPLNKEARKLRFARCCYDHLAGNIGVAITQGLISHGFLCIAQNKRYDITPDGVAWFADMGLEVATLKPNRLGIARQCLDWTERQHHLAGPLGVGLLSLLCAKGWCRRVSSSRAVQVTPEGWHGLHEHLGITRAQFEDAA